MSIELDFFRGGESAVKTEPKKQKINTLEQDITPNNPNLVRNKRLKNTIRPEISKPKIAYETVKVQAYDYSGEVEPFKDATHFMKYYRAFLLNCANSNNGSKVNFDQYSADSIYATQILDLLQEQNRSNKVFLASWIRYFYDYRLKGSKALKTKYTSLKAFKESFEEYNVRHANIV